MAKDGVIGRPGFPVICVETRHMRDVLKAQINKTDRNDARGKPFHHIGDFIALIKQETSGCLARPLPLSRAIHAALELAIAAITCSTASRAMVDARARHLSKARPFDNHGQCRVPVQRWRCMSFRRRPARTSPTKKLRSVMAITFLSGLRG